jgi:hypothetical protein
VSASARFLLRHSPANRKNWSSRSIVPLRGPSRPVPYLRRLYCLFAILVENTTETE